MLAVEKEAVKPLNQYAREQMKAKLCADILFDIQVCEIEGWDKLEYLEELKKMIDEIFINSNKRTEKSEIPIY